LLGTPPSPNATPAVVAVNRLLFGSF
jgi:hypothetical protein